VVRISPDVGRNFLLLEISGRPVSADVAPAEAQVREAIKRLRAPFDVEAIRASQRRAMRPMDCPAPPPALRAPLGIPFYADSGAEGRHSIPDPVRTAENEAQIRPLRLYVEGVMRRANQFVRTRPAETSAAACVLTWIDAWASADALLAEGHPTQGGFERKWTLGALALAYLQIRDAPGLDPAARTRVLAWFRALATRVRAVYDRPFRDTLLSSARNNHMTWAGAAVGAAAIALDDRALFDWAMSRARLTLEQVTTEGHLPREMARGAMALHYHLFTLMPAALLDRMAAANGVTLDPAALERLARASLAAAHDPRRFEGPAGAVQVVRNGTTFRHSNAAAFELWRGAAADGQLQADLAPQRPYRMNWLGGDTSLLYGATAPR